MSSLDYATKLPLLDALQWRLCQSQTAISKGARLQGAGLGSLISLLGLLSFGVSLHIEYFTP